MHNSCRIADKPLALDFVAILRSLELSECIVHLIWKPLRCAVGTDLQYKTFNECSQSQTDFRLINASRGLFEYIYTEKWLIQFGLGTMRYQRNVLYVYSMHGLCSV